MLQRLKESSIAAAMKASNIRIVDAASTPKRPYKPNTRSTPRSACSAAFSSASAS
jgi:hypothetical protein